MTRKHGVHKQHPRRPCPRLPSCCFIRQLSNYRAWCLGDAVIGAWCSHRRGMLKVPLADVRVKIFEFPGEHEPFILETGTNCKNAPFFQNNCKSAPSSKIISKMPLVHSVDVYFTFQVPRFKIYPIHCIIKHVSGSPPRRDVVEHRSWKPKDFHIWYQEDQSDTPMALTSSGISDT